MELRHLEAFTVIAAERSFTRAAQRLNISQPPLTRLVQQLERELGIALFRRHARGVDLTTEGELLLDRAKCLVAQAHDFLDTIARGDSAEAGIVRIGIAWGLHEVALGGRARHAEQFPGVTLDVEGMASEQQEDALRQRKIDVGILREIGASERLQMERLFDERFVVLVSENNPLARKRGIPLEALSGEPVMRGPDVTDAAYERLLRLYALYGVKPVEIAEHASPADELSIRLTVSSGKGICVALSSDVTPISPAGGIAVVPLDEANATSPVCMACRRGEASPVVLQFLDSMRQLHLDCDRPR